MKFGLLRRGVRKSVKNDVPPGAHWITISRAAHPSSPLAGRHLLLDEAGVIIGGAVPEEFYGKTLAQTHMTGAASTDKPFHTAVTRVLGDVTPLRVDQLAQAFHAHPSASVSERLKTVAVTLEKMGYTQRAARQTTAQIAAALLDAKHLQPCDVQAWTRDGQTTAKNLTPHGKAQRTVLRALLGDFAKAAEQKHGRTFVRSLLQYAKDEAVTASEMQGQGRAGVAAGQKSVMRDFGRRLGFALRAGILSSETAEQIFDAWVGAAARTDSAVAEQLKQGKFRVNQWETSQQILQNVLGNDASEFFARPVSKLGSTLAKIVRTRDAKNSHAEKFYQAVAVLERTTQAAEEASGSESPEGLALTAAMGFLQQVRGDIETKSQGKAAYMAARLGALPPDIDLLETSTEDLVGYVIDGLQAQFPRLPRDVVARQLARLSKLPPLRGLGNVAALIARAAGGSAEDVQSATFMFLPKILDEMKARKLFYAHVKTDEAVAPWWMRKVDQRTHAIDIGKNAIGGVRTLTLAPPDEAKAVKKLFAESRNPAHHSTVDVDAVYKLTYDHPEFDAFAKKHGNVRRLFHGTQNRFAALCVASGLKPPGTATGVDVSNGSMFGQGVYFADQSTKSAQYTSLEDDGVMFLCDVALGHEMSADRAMNDLNVKNFSAQKEKVYTIDDPQRAVQFVLGSQARYQLLTAVHMLSNEISLAGSQGAQADAAVNTALDKAFDGDYETVYDALRGLYHFFADRHEEGAAEAIRPFLRRNEFAEDDLLQLLKKPDADEEIVNQLKRQQYSLERTRRAQFLLGAMPASTLEKIKMVTARAMPAETHDAGFSENMVAYDSIYAHPSSSLRNNEWVVFDPHQIQMQYVVKVRVHH